MKHPPRNTLGYTPGGSRLTRMDLGGPPPPRVPGDDVLVEAVERHLDEHFPGPGDVLVPEEWDGVRIAIHARPPTAERAFWVFMTSGMASREMKRPRGWVDPKVRFFGELFLTVDAGWPGFHFDPDAPRGDRFNPDTEGPHAACTWPLVAMLQIAEVPHGHGLCLTPGSSVPNLGGGRYAEGSELSGAIVFGVLPEDPTAGGAEEPPFATFQLREREVGVMQVVLVDDREMDLKVELGPEVALPLLHKVGALGPLGVERGNAADEAEKILTDAGGLPADGMETMEANPYAPFGDEPLLEAPGGYRVREDADAGAPTLQELDGRWRVVLYGEGGEYAPEGVAEEMSFEVEYSGGRYTSRRSGEVVDAGRVTVEAGTDAGFTRIDARSDRADPASEPMRTLVRAMPAAEGRARECEQLTGLPPGTRLNTFSYGFGTPASYARIRWAGPARERKHKPRKRPGRARRR